MEKFPTQFATLLHGDTVVLGSVEFYLRHFASDYITTPSGVFEVLSVDVQDYDIYLNYTLPATDCSDCDEAGFTEGNCQCSAEWFVQIDHNVIDVYGYGAVS
jgi:hypothetical protein